MPSPPPTRIREIFEAAVDLPLQGRADFIAEQCCDDAPLRNAVEELLSAHEKAGDFLADPTIVPPAIADQLPRGSRIGSYAILESIGEGGFSNVYLAQQDPPLARRVALKVIKPGMDTRQVIARFELERSAVALMEH